MALMPTERMGPPPGASPPMRMAASWSGSNDPTAYKSVARRCLQWRAPLGSSTDRQAPSRRRSYAKNPVAVHHPSACSGLKRCETPAPLGGSRQALLAFRSLDPFRALREPDRRRRDEERPSRSEQRTLSKHYLTGKAPYKFVSSPSCKEPNSLADQISVAAAGHSLDHPTEQVRVRRDIVKAPAMRPVPLGHGAIERAQNRMAPRLDRAGPNWLPCDRQ